MADQTHPPRAETPVSPLYSAFPLPASRVSSVQLQRLSHRGDGADLMTTTTTMSARNSRSQAMSPSPSIISSFSTSSAVHQQPASPTNVYPLPAYVAEFGATQVVSERKRHSSDDEDDDDDSAFAKPAREEMHFSADALALLNGFLDHLLYSILLQARSTTLTALRPAVTEVLRSRLASEAIASAEEELSELLAGGEEEEEEMNQKQSVSERKRKWDTELVWKRTRLRVMVYIRLGEMEDDDEERYVREDELFHSAGDRRFSHSTGLVSWAAAIFLTSVLEYVAEQLLQVAAQAADVRARRLTRNSRGTVSASGMGTPVDSLTVHDHDMEKCALHKTAGRLWRNWRKSLRSNAAPSPTPMSSSSNTNTNNNNSSIIDRASRRLSRYRIDGTAISPRRSSFGGPESVSAADESRPISRLDEHDRGVSEGGADDELEYPEHVLAANIPLPMTDDKQDIEEIEYPEHVFAANIPLPMEDEKKDVDEIDVPGLARDPDAAEELTATEPRVQRRNSWAGSMPMLIIFGAVRNITTRLNEADAEPAVMTKFQEPVPEKLGELQQAVVTRARASSLPVLLVKPSPALQAHAASTSNASEEAEVEGPAGGEEDEPKHDQKAHVAKLAAHKSEVVSEDNAPVTDEKSSGSRSNEHTGHNFERKVFPGAVASAPVVVASAAVGSKAHVWSSNAVEAKGNGVESAQEEEKSSEVATEQADVQQVDAREDQKALKDMKRLSVLNGQNLKRRSSGLAGEDVSRTPKRMSLTQAMLVRSASSKDITNRPWTVDNSTRNDPLAPAAPRDNSAESNRSQGKEKEQVVDIGVARTSDAAVSTPTKGEFEEGVYQARENFTNPTPQRRSRIVLNDSPVSSTSSLRDSVPNAQEDDAAASTLSPESFLKGRSLSAKRATKIQHLKPVGAQSPHGQTRAHAPKSPVRIGTPDNVGIVKRPVSPVSDRTPSPWQQTFSAVIKETTQWTSSSKKSAPVSDSGGLVQQHPALQKKASRSQLSLKEPESTQPLTSASIRGPEDFEMFVQGGDTVKYTLTPESVRGDPSFIDVAPYLRTSPSAEAITSAPKKQSPVQPPVEDFRVGRSQSANQATAAGADAGAGAADGRASSPTSSRDKRRSTSRPPVRNTSVHRKSGLMAREPQVLTESTRDFADFIRSTGPDKEPQLRPLLNNRSTTSLQALRDAHISGSRSQSPGPSRARSMSRSHIEAEDLPPVPAVVPPMPATNRMRSNMQPRAPTQTAEFGTSELIDFIRTGPNEFDSSDERQHRISRSVAPFRTTMDSDQLQEWGERSTPQLDLKINTNIANVQNAPSVLSADSLHNSHRTSANSRSALLRNSVTTPQDFAQPAYTEQPVRLTSVIPTSVQQAFPTSPEGITRTRVRNKDPYAMYFDDDEEDDDLLTALPKGRQREQESLIDFLRNSEPPEPNSSRPATNGKGPASPTSPGRGSASPGLKTFGADAVSFGRRGSVQNRDGPQPARSGPPSSNHGTATIAVGPITKSRPDLEPRVRDAEYTGPGGTRDLADFFRSSAPPSSSHDSVPRAVQRSGSKASVVNSKASIASSKRSRISFLSGGMSSIFGRGASRKAY